MTLLTKQDLEDIREIATHPEAGIGLNPHSALKLLNAYEQLVATLDDVACGSKHELVRHLLDKLIAAEKQAEAAVALKNVWLSTDSSVARSFGLALEDALEDALETPEHPP